MMLKILPGLFVVVIAAVPASADQSARDAVMAGAFRCNGIAADREWLQCYYGAAQPLRAALRLPPATPRQISLSQSLSSDRQGEASAERNAAIMNVARCASPGDDRKWLDCFYGAMQPVRAALGLPPAPQAARSEAGLVANPPPPPPRRQEGFFSGLLGDGRTRVHLRMKTCDFDREGLFTITLEDGEVWKQLPGDGLEAHWHSRPQGYFVTIKDGALGSFNLRVDGEDRFYKVARVK